MTEDHRFSLNRVQTLFAETFGLGRAVAFSVFLLIIAVTIFALYWFFHSGPPDTITITTGPEGSIFKKNAEKYAEILARNGVTLKIITSEGSRENLMKLADPSSHVDIGFVEGGVAEGVNTEKLVSLGSVSYAPLLVFYRSAAPVELFSQFKGKRLAIGPEGSGTRSIALTLLAANGIEPDGATELLDLEAQDAAKALLNGEIEAAFLMGESASINIIRSLLFTPGIRIFEFTQADGYSRRIVYLNKLTLPKGSIDFGKDIPAHDLNLIGPTVELIARSRLHPALSDLLLEAAREVHGKPNLFQHRGEFPAPLDHEIRISSEAHRFYKSGMGFLYRSLPFRLASLVNRILVVFIPFVIIMIPGLKLIPALYRWRIELRFYRWYRALLVLEKDLVVKSEPDKREELLAHLDDIEKAVNKMKVPAFFADQFYGLRGHIMFVRGQLMDNERSGQPHTTAGVTKNHL